MKTLFLAATALMIGGSALAYQTEPDPMTDLTPPPTAVDPAATVETATPVAATVGDRIVQASNADPEHDARGIAVISDPAVVPDGYNGHAATGMGGPLVDPATGETVDAADGSYPACTATVTDNCIQLYERGVRAQAGVGGPFEPAAGGTSTPTASKPAGTTATSMPSTTDATAKPTTTDPGGQETGTTPPDQTGTTEDDTTKPDY